VSSALKFSVIQSGTKDILCSHFRGLLGRIKENSFGS